MPWTKQIGGKDVIVERDDYGDWVLVQNYEHYGGETPIPSAGSTFPSLPNGRTNVSDIQKLGTTGELKQVDNIDQYSSRFSNVDAVRLEGMTSNHNRKVHFFTEDSTVVQSVLDGSTAPAETDFQNLVTKYPDHTANLPDAATGSTGDNTDRIFEHEYPFYEGGTYHWAEAGGGNRWEVDDYTNDASQTTIHRVWARLPGGVDQPSAVNRTTDDEVLKT